MSYKAQFRVWRGDAGWGTLTDYQVEVNEGEVVLDILHRLQATQVPDLAVRWNCKAGKCGSCSMEINGRPRLACMTRMNVFAEDETVTVTPMRTDLLALFERDELKKYMTGDELSAEDGAAEPGPPSAAEAPAELAGDAAPADDGAAPAGKPATPEETTR